MVTYREICNIPDIFAIKRVAKNPDGIFGVMIHHTDGKDIPFAVTLEHPEKFIDSGVYVCKRDRYNKGGYPAYQIIVQDRTHIKIHGGNLKQHTEGCVLVAESYGNLKGYTAILQSMTLRQGGFNEFMQRANGAEKILLYIIDNTEDIAGYRYNGRL